jgi:hypothetical protein
LKNSLIAVFAIAMLAVGFGAAFLLNPSTTRTTTSTYTLTYSTTVTGSQSQGSEYELNCVVSFYSETLVPANITASGQTSVTTFVVNLSSSLLKDYTSSTSVSSDAGVAVSTTTLLASATYYPIWNETVCTWLPR